MKKTRILNYQTKGEVANFKTNPIQEKHFPKLFNLSTQSKEKVEKRYYELEADTDKYFVDTYLG